MKTSAALASAAALPGVALGADAPPAAPASAPAKLKIGIVGVGGRGWDHVSEIALIDVADIVALCDVDVNRLVRAARHVSAADTYVDYREMLERPDLQAVVVATPDHTHAVVTAGALRAGKHVYCEKPLTHTIAEARAIMALAEQTKLVTQMGIQIHALDNYRRVVELIRAGAIGDVSEVNIWNNRTNRPAAAGKSAPPSKPPATFDYDLWLGPALDRPYQADFHPYNWRRYWAFGSGLLGDIACHLMDVAFWALDLKHPTRVETKGAPLDDDVTTEWTIATYDFPARSGKPPVKLTWYDPPQRPPQITTWNLPENLAGEGVMFVGSEGRMLYTNYRSHLLLPEATFKDFKPPAPSIPASPGHQREWIDACLKNDPSAASTPFSYGGLLTESALLGTVAFRAQKPLEWDAENLRATNAPEADAFVKTPYRPGWTLQ